MKKFSILLICMFLVTLAPAVAQQAPVRIIFMHHSTGQGLIWQGGVREAFAALGYEFWDHGYNDEGLTDPNGNAMEINWDVPGDNTDPDGWAAIFSQPVTDPPTNTFSHMLQYDVIIFKSCFPTSNIEDDDMFQSYQSYFLDMRDVMDQHPDKLFIAFTTPPLVPNETTAENAARARRWAAYLTSPEFLDGHPNVVVFDFFSALADSDGYLRAEYRGDEWDSHPNERANQTVGPLFVTFVDQAIRDFVPAIPSGVPTVESPAGDTIADFEDVNALTDWWIYTNEGVSEFTCTLDNGALRLMFDIAGGGNAGCGVDLDADLAVARGLTFRWRADQPGVPMRVGLGVAQAADEEATPFEVELTTGTGDWSQVSIRWDEMVKPEWVGDAGPAEFDPALVVWLDFDVGHWQDAEAGSIWIDDIRLMTGD